MSYPTTINTHIYNQPTFQAIVNPRTLKGIEVNKKSTYASFPEIHICKSLSEHFLTR